MSVKPPLAVSVVSRDPQGVETIWWSGSPRAWERPQGISFSTRRGEGFSEATMTLSRDVRLDWVDLGLLNEIVIVGDDGFIIYEGRINGTPRTFESGGQQSFAINCIGHMGAAEDTIFSERYVDARFDQWQPMGVQRRTAILTTLSRTPGDGQVTPDSGNPALTLEAQGAWAANAQPQIEMWYDASAGVAIGHLTYAWRQQGLTDPSWEWLAGLSADDTASSIDVTPNLAAPGPNGGTLDATTSDRRYAFVQLYYPLANGNDNTKYDLFWTCLAVIGRHGLTFRTAGDATTPPALWLTDILRNIAQRFCPQFDLSGVQDNPTLIYQAAYDDSTPFAAWQELNSFALWELAVWEGKTLTYAPADLTDYDWEVRLTDPGVSTTLQGFDATDLRNGIVVTYTDSITGKTERLTPDQHSELRDDSPDNPANLWGLRKWGPEPFAVPVPCTQAMALDFGQAKLAEMNTPKELGQISVTGHIRDRAGHWHPVSHVRAGETVAITDFPNSRARLVGETSYDQDSYRLDISTDGPAQTLEAFFDRLASRRTATNLN